MNNGRVSSRGGVEDPLPQLGPSQPAAVRRNAVPSSKRKAPDEEDTQMANSKRVKVRS